MYVLCTLSMETLTVDAPHNRTVLGSRDLPMASSKLWRSLPSSVHSLRSLMSFRSKLKARLLQLAYPSYRPTLVSNFSDLSDFNMASIDYDC